METMIVKRDMVNTYSNIDLEEAKWLVEQGYDYVTIIGLDGIIQLVFPMDGIKATEEQMRIEIINYLTRVE